MGGGEGSGGGDGVAGGGVDAGGGVVLELGGGDGGLGVGDGRRSCAWLTSSRGGEG